MLTSDFTAELGGLIRSLQQRVLMEPALTNAYTVPSGHPADAVEHIDRAIVSLIAIRFSIQGKGIS